MVIAIILFAFALLSLVYAIGVGIYWYSQREVIDNDAEAKRVIRDDRLHDDIQNLIKILERIYEKQEGIETNKEGEKK